MSSPLISLTFCSSLSPYIPLYTHFSSSQYPSEHREAMCSEVWHRYLILSRKNHQCQFFPIGFFIFKFFHFLKITELLFREMYPRLPDDFDFASYLSKCFKRYVLQTIDLGIWKWAIIVFLAMCNYLRVRFHGYFNCHSQGAVYDRANNHRRLSIDTISTIASDSPQPFRSDTIPCKQQDVALFWRCALGLCAYVLIVYISSRLYELR